MKTYVEILVINPRAHEYIRWDNGDIFKVGQIRECEIEVNSDGQCIVCSHYSTDYRNGSGRLIQIVHGRFRVLSPLEILARSCEAND